MVMLDIKMKFSLYDLLDSNLCDARIY